MEAYYEFFLSNSPFAVKWRQRLSIVFGVCTFCGFSAISLSMGQPAWIIYGLVFQVIFGFVYLRYTPNTDFFASVNHRNRELYSIWVRNRIVGKNELILSSNAMQKIRSDKRRLTKYTRINHIEDIGTHVFIYDDYPVPNIIPKNKIAEGDLDAFVAALKQKL